MIVADAKEWFVDTGGAGRDSMADNALAARALIVDRVVGTGHRRQNNAIEATPACSCGVDDRC